MSTSDAPSSHAGGLTAAALIAAAGRGSRFGADQPKQWLPLGGEPLVAHSVRFFARLPRVREILVALDPDSLVDAARVDALRRASGTTPLRLVAGSGARQESVWQALQALAERLPLPDLVLVHDAARPFPPVEAVERSLDEAARAGGAILACPLVETVKRANADLEVVETLDRSTLWTAQTPQTFRCAELIEAYRAQEDRLAGFTDDAGLFEAWGGRVRLVESSRINFKITTPEDFARAERWLRESAGN
jgi:2-C-methyl-D-erythritol 4-phosphate cytidylyltransferase